jgi:hypothetical protein
MGKKKEYILDEEIVRTKNGVLVYTTYTKDKLGKKMYDKMKKEVAKSMDEYFNIGFKGVKKGQYRKMPVGWFKEI